MIPQSSGLLLLLLCVYVCMCCSVDYCTAEDVWHVLSAPPAGACKPVAAASKQSRAFVSAWFAAALSHPQCSGDQDSSLLPGGTSLCGHTATAGKKAVEWPKLYGTIWAAALLAGLEDGMLQ
jgi:hypothetical protein